MRPPGRNVRGRVLVGTIGAPHGLNGEVRIKSYTAEPAAIARYGPLENADGTRTFEIESVRPAKPGLIARFKGVTDRTAAERLRNLELYAARERLPPTEPDEFYHADLIGLTAMDAEGAVLGQVLAVHNFGAGDVIEIESAGGGPALMLPFTEAVVPAIDIPGGKLVVHPPEAASDDMSEMTDQPE